MNDEMSYNSGRMIAWLLYIVQCVATIFMLLQKLGEWNYYMTMLLSFCIISAILISLLTEDRGFSAYSYCVFMCICSTICSIIITYAYSDLLMLMAVYIIQCLIVVLFKEDKSCVVIGLTNLFAVALFETMDVLGIIHFITLPVFLISSAVIITSMWIMHNHIKMLRIRDKKQAEQEKSLDDMLRVVEVMCDEAREATKSKSDFLSNMSHEIRTPINSVLGMNEMIIRESEEPEITEYALNIASSGNMLLSLVNDILDFSKIESGKMEIVPVDYGLSSVINDLVNIISSRIEDKGLEFILDVDEKTPEFLHGDEVRIRQIVTNILTNAVKYTDKGSVVLKISFEDDRSNLVFQVRDTGRGIKKEDMESLFDAFKRADERKNRNIEGTGLGLAIVHNFVEMMNGTIHVDSEYGSGSTFTIKIPQIVCGNTTIGNFSERLKEANQSRDNYQELFIAPTAEILVVDDNGVNLKVASLLLKATKIKVHTATSGIQAIELLKNNKYDVVLLDHMMPQMDGIQTLEELRKQDLLGDCPVIALTANAVSGAREMYLEKGFNDYLSKPIVGKDFEKLLMKWLPSEKIQLSGFGDEGRNNDYLENGDPVDYKQDEKEISEKDGEIVGSLIDLEVALEYSAGDMGMYDMIAQSFLEEIDEKIAALCSFFEKSDYDNYRIEVHAIKSDTLGIGAVSISELAKELEFAARDGRFDLIREKHDRLLKMLEALIKELKAR
ncbi:MAG: response regulator [Lachnospiraceae bacterium]|nr:response regulator [Lachnospiraceae bacterium]